MGVPQTRTRRAGYAGQICEPHPKLDVCATVFDEIIAASFDFDYQRSSDLFAAATESEDPLGALTDLLRFLFGGLKPRPNSGPPASTSRDGERRWSIHPRQARKSDPASLRRRYDAAMDAVLAALETVPDSDWGLGARFYGERFYTVADLFATPGHHLVEHTTGM